VSTTSIPFVNPFAKGFQITSRVFTDPDDKLAHFDDILLEKKEAENENEQTSTPSSPTRPIVLPYWECGVAGSTTVPVPLSSLTVRHVLGGSKPATFNKGCGRGEAGGIGGIGIGGSGNDDTHPRLAVPLTPMKVSLNSGETRLFQPGDVILFENCLTGGHILQGHEGQDMIVILLTLPHPYHHVGKERNSLSSIFGYKFWKENPCKTGLKSSGVHGAFGNGRSDSNELEGINLEDNILVRLSRSSRVRRRLGLGVVGAGLSLALADFLGKVAPLALAVVAGGGLVFAGGTYGVVKIGEYGLDELDFWQERRLLRLQDAGDSVGGDRGTEGDAAKSQDS